MALRRPTLFRRPFSIRVQLAALVLAVVAPMAATFGWLLHETVAQAHGAARAQVAGISRGATAALRQLLQASPVHGEGGAVVGTVSAEVGVIALQQAVLGSVDGDATVLLLDRAGRVLLASTNAAQALGQGAPAALLDALRAREATFVLADAEGARQLYAAQVEPASGWTVVAGLPEAPLIAPVRALRLRALALVALALAAALWLAWRIAERIVTPVRALAATAERLALGERGARALAQGPVELRDLAGHVNRMLDVQASDALALRESEDRLQRAIKASRLSLWDIDLSRGEVWLSESWSTLLGGPPHATRASVQALGARVPDEDLPRLQRALADALRNPEVAYRVEHRVRRDDGSEFWNLSEGRVIERDANGRALRLVGTNRDITERKVAEAALKDSEATLRAVVDNALEAVVRIDATGAVVGWNAQAERTFGWVAHEALGRPLHELIVPAAARDAHQRGMQRLLAGGHSTILNRRLELSAQHRDGHELPVELAITPVRVGERHEFSAFIRDLSEVRRAEASRLALEGQLRESQKMEAIGTLAGGIAHDFNNIVGAILGHTALVRDELPPDHAVQASLQHVHRAGIRARTLVQQILAFSRREPQQLVARALAPVVDETLALLRSTLPAGALLEAALSAEPLHAMADATQLQQVLLNLCTNAWHALPDGRGRITVGLDAVTLDAQSLRPGALAPGRYVRLTVRDDGCGMDAATRARVFEPFFTTKPVGQGTGLGLAVVHGIVQSHHGAITLDSTPGRGSVFSIVLPRVEPEVAPAASDWGLLDPASPGHGEHVLCLDDDEVMLLLAQQLLTRAGYRVSCFQDARAALDAFAARPEAFDAVVTDYHMPRLSGMDVARAVLRIRPGLPVVIGSGDLSDALRAEAARHGVAQLLRKENLFAELAAVVQRALAQARACSIG